MGVKSAETDLSLGGEHLARGETSLLVHQYCLVRGVTCCSVEDNLGVFGGRLSLFFEASLVWDVFAIGAVLLQDRAALVIFLNRVDLEVAEVLSLAWALADRGSSLQSETGWQRLNRLVSNQFLIYFSTASALMMAPLGN